MRSRHHTQELGRRPAIGAGPVHARALLTQQRRHAHHEKFVEVRRDYRQELHPLEQRMRRILGLREHAPVEFNPAQLPIDVERQDRPGRRLACRYSGPSAGSSRSTWRHWYASRTTLAFTAAAAGCRRRPARVRAPRESTADRPQAPFVPHGPVQMPAQSPRPVTDPTRPDRFARRHRVAQRDARRRQVREEREQAQAVVDDDRVSPCKTKRLWPARHGRHSALSRTVVPSALQKIRAGVRAAAPGH